MSLHKVNGLHAWLGFRPPLTLFSACSHLLLSPLPLTPPSGQRANASEVQKLHASRSFSQIWSTHPTFLLMQRFLHMTAAEANRMTDRKKLDMDKPRASSPAGGGGGGGDDPGIVWVESSIPSGGYSIKHASKPSTEEKDRNPRETGAARLKTDQAEGETDEPEHGK